MAWWIIWGWLCAIAGSVMSVPQVLRLLRVGTSAGLAPLMWQLNTAAIASWSFHGLRTGAWNVTLSNLVSAALSALVIRMIQADRRLSPRIWLIPAAALAALCVVEYLAPPGVFGAVVVVPFAVGMLSQTRDLVRDPDISGLSAAYMVLAFVIQAMWWLWGLAAGDTSIVICATVLGVIGLVNLVLFVRRRLAGAPA